MRYFAYGKRAYYASTFQLDISDIKGDHPIFFTSSDAIHQVRTSVRLL